MAVNPMQRKANQFISFRNFNNTFDNRCYYCNFIIATFKIK